MTEEDVSRALDAMRLTSKKAAQVQSKSPSSRWIRWLWIVVAITLVVGLLALAVLAVIAMGLMATA